MRLQFIKRLYGKVIDIINKNGTVNY